jgi:hypothetical protein
MGKGESAADKRLTCRIHTRITQEKYNELSVLMKQSRGIHSLSELLRSILDNKKIVVQTYDTTMDKITEQLAGIRKELLAIGININQATRALHQACLSEEQLLQAKKILKDFRQANLKIIELFTVIDKLSERWLPK